jgi:hypothetical protein
MLCPFSTDIVLGKIESGECKGEKADRGISVSPLYPMDRGRIPDTGIREESLYQKCSEDT